MDPTATPAASPSLASAADSIARPGAPPVTHKVLVADDDADILEILRMVLVAEGFVVVTTALSSEVVTLVEGEKPDVVLLDVAMPGIDGFEVCRRLKARASTSDVPVIFLSAQHRNAEVIAQGLECGGHDYVTKPVQKPELLARIRAALRIRLYESELSLKNAHLEELNDQLKRLLARHEEYLGMASHDLRAPLMSLVGYSGLLMDGAYGPVSPKQVQIIRRFRILVSYMSSIVANLLDLETLERGALRLYMQREDLAGILAEAMELHGLAADEKEVSLALEALPGAELPINADRNRMVQVLSNVIANAIKYSPPKQPVRVALQRHNGRAFIRVADRGPGIPAGERERVFQPFFQGSNRPTNGEKGAGLGLCIVKQLVDLHGGQVQIIDALGGGTCVEIELPVFADESS